LIAVIPLSVYPFFPSRRFPPASDETPSINPVLPPPEDTVPSFLFKIFFFAGASRWFPRTQGESCVSLHGNVPAPPIVFFGRSGAKIFFPPLSPLPFMPSGFPFPPGVRQFSQAGRIYFLLFVLSQMLLNSTDAAFFFPLVDDEGLPLPSPLLPTFPFPGLG